MTGWLSGGWGEPVYYDYGDNLTYQEGEVYLDGEPIASEEEYAEQAMAYAEAGQQTTDDQVEWMPLGVFALAPGKEDESIMMLQLAVSKEGLISGTYVNLLTDATEPVQGSVDKKTQRAAWSIGDNTGTVVETGIYNLTKDETPVLVHFGKDRTQTWLMARLEQPKDGEAGAAAPKAPGKR